jgi:hypothetical protein
MATLSLAVSGVALGTAMNVTSDDLRSYYDALARHEWTFDFAEDCCIWEKGWRELEHLQGMATKNPRLAELFRDFSNYIWGGAPKPERP